MILNSYKLLDFGDGQKMEQFGNRIVIRPSSLAETPKRYPELWGAPAAIFNEDKGWKVTDNTGEEWVIEENQKEGGYFSDASAASTGDQSGYSLLLRLQQNGQIGIFPEHSTYLGQVQEFILGGIAKGRQVSLLNLFAYTGMCSIVAQRSGAEVCHVDAAKPPLDWARANFEQNKIENIRLIKEDALTFLRKEVKRGRTYQAIVIDPPGFSRFKEGSWSVGDIAAELVELCTLLLDPDFGAIFFTFHGTELNGEIVRNLFLDRNFTSPEKIEVRPLTLHEKTSGRRLPAGTLVYGTR